MSIKCSISLLILGFAPCLLAQCKLPDSSAVAEQIRAVVLRNRDEYMRISAKYSVPAKSKEENDRRVAAKQQEHDKRESDYKAGMIALANDALCSQKRALSSRAKGDEDAEQERTLKALAAGDVSKADASILATYFERLDKRDKK